MSPSPLTIFAVGWAAALLGTSAAAVLRPMAKAKREGANTAPADVAPPGVLLIRPVAGADPWLAEALASAPTGVDRTRLRIRIAVASEEDSAHPVAVAAVARLAEAGFSASLCLTSAKGLNRKAAQLAAVLEGEPRHALAEGEAEAEAEAEDVIIVVADADVDLGASPLAELIAPFVDPLIGAVWAPPVECAAPLTLADRASQALLGGSLHAFPLLARLDNGGLVGKLCAVRRSSLDAIGGFEALVPWLGEDTRLAELLGARGDAFVSTQRPAISVANGRSAGAVVARYGRWLHVIRAQRPWLLLSYPALFFGTFPAIALCLTLAIDGSAPWLGAVAGALFLGRLVVAAAAARAAGRARSWLIPLSDIFLADLLLALAFCVATTQRHVAWKEGRFTFDRRGMLREAEVPRAIA